MRLTALTLHAFQVYTAFFRRHLETREVKPVEGRIAATEQDGGAGLITALRCG